MTNYSELVQRLRNHDYLNDYFFGEWGFDAADVIEAQAKRIEELEAALKEVAVCLDGDRTGEDLLFAVRAAKAALEKKDV